jgi:hypothetical protein
MNIFDIKKDGTFIDLMVPNWKIGFFYSIVFACHRFPGLRIQ